MFKENGKTWTDDEYIVRMWEKEYLTDLASRFMYAWSNGERRRALDELWVRTTRNQRDASFGVNNGFYIGMEEITRYFVGMYEEECRGGLASFREAGYTDAAAGIGMMTMHHATTPLIYIADDGQTARMLCYDVGMDAQGKPDGTAKSWFEIALCFIEFIKEGEDWKIWHVIWAHDFSIETGKDYAQMPRILSPEAQAEFTRHHGTPTKEFDVYDDTFGWEYIYWDMPVPYRTYEEEEGYGPNGKVGRKYYDRIV